LRYYVLGQHAAERVLHRDVLRGERAHGGQHLRARLVDREGHAGIIAAVGAGWYPRGMPEAPFGARRPHPVADVPPPALADGQAPAKAWLLALVAARPLQDAPALPMPDLARDAPGLCAAILRAVGSDAELRRLQDGGDLVALAARAGALAGAGGPAAAVAAVAQLRAALWQALTLTMAPLDAATTAALAERLAFVCDAVTAATLNAAGARVDAVASFRVHDARGHWSGAVERLAAEGRPFALLAIEADDAARLVAADADAAAGALARVEQAARGELRLGDVLGREDDGRLWIVVAELGAPGARALAERLADAVAAVAPLRGAPLTVSIGVAASPADGVDVEALTARADESLYAARAAGVPFG
jgi:GGDEF domain-containing protein